MIKQLFIVIAVWVALTAIDYLFFAMFNGLNPQLWTGPTCGGFTCVSIMLLVIAIMAVAFPKTNYYD